MPGMNIRFGLVEITRFVRTTSDGASLIVAASNDSGASEVVFCCRATAEGAASTAMTATVDRQRRATTRLILLAYGIQFKLPFCYGADPAPQQPSLDSTAVLISGIPRVIPQEAWTSATPTLSQQPVRRSDSVRRFDGALTGTLLHRCACLRARP